MNYLFGPKSIQEAIKDRMVIIKKVYLINTKKDLINLLKNKKIKYEIISNKNFFNKWNNTLNHQNCVAEIEPNNFFNDIKLFIEKDHDVSCKKLILILDEINDPRNFGSIIRTSYAMGVNAIIYKKNNQSQINELVVKTSLGACYFIPMIKVSNISNAMNILKENGYWIYCSSLSEKSIDYNKVNYDQKSVLIIGSESNGVSRNIEKNSDFHIKIPMKNNFDSLNVSVATGILISKILN